MLEIDRLIKELEYIILNYNEDLLCEFEDKLYDIHVLKDPNVIGKLILLLNDNFKYDELMFSIIHIIEYFEDSLYVNKVLSTLPDSVYVSPKWMLIIFNRILNSKSSLKYLKKNIIKLDDVRKKILIDLFESIENDDELKLKLLDILPHS